MRSLPPRLELVAIDDGFDFTKAVARSMKTACIPTAYARNPSLKASAMGGGLDTENVYEIEGSRYAVGPYVVSGDTRFDEFPYHPANLAIAMDALRRVVEPATPVHVIAGVPLNRFYSDGTANDSISEKKTYAWSRVVRPLQGPALPHIARVSVISEALAAWFDHVIDDNFNIRHDLANDFMAVVDIGGRTTDIAVLENRKINFELSGTMDSGVLGIRRRISDVVAAKYPALKIPRALLDEAMTLGRLSLGAGEIDVSTHVLDGRRSLALEIEDFLHSRFGSQMPLMKRVLFVGGGAKALQTDLSTLFPSAVFARNPQMANARGMLKFGVAVAEYENEDMVANA